jgi:hypothetical protein
MLEAVASPNDYFLKLYPPSQKAANSSRRMNAEMVSAKAVRPLQNVTKVVISSSPGVPALALHDLLSYIDEFSETGIINGLILMPGLGQGPGDPVRLRIFWIPRIRGE